jgi:hypothetical protein
MVPGADAMPVPARTARRLAGGLPVFDAGLTLFAERGYHGSASRIAATWASTPCGDQIWRSP